MYIRLNMNVNVFFNYMEIKTMKSMKFLSLSLLLVSFGGSVLASQPEKEEIKENAVETKETVSDTVDISKTVEEQEKKSAAKNDNQDEGKKENDNKGEDKSSDDKEAGSILTTVKSTLGIDPLSYSRLGLGASVVAIAGGTVAYKYHAGFNQFVNETATAVKEQVNEIKNDGKKAGLVLGGLTVVGAGVTAYKLGYIGGAAEDKKEDKTSNSATATVTK